MKSKVIIVLIFAAFLSNWIPVFSASRNDSTVIRYYLENLDSVCAGQYIFNAGVPFTFTLNSIYQQTNYRGMVNKSDTAKLQFFFSGGRQDSVKIIDSAKFDKNIIPSSFAVPAVWRETYVYSFYPNDTGAGILAIGFDLPSGSTDHPVGFLTLDRNRYFLQSLFLGYVHKEGYREYSQTFRFKEFGEYYILQRWEIDGSINTITGIKYFRQIYELYDYKLGGK
jgi:hypothetical protein